ncbi:MAG: hypothetical protein QW815_04275 [Nitrososphaerota archaeon]
MRSRQGHPHKLWDAPALLIASELSSMGWKGRIKGGMAAKRSVQEVEEQIEREATVEHYRGKHCHEVVRSGKKVVEWHAIDEKHWDVESEEAHWRTYSSHEGRRGKLYSFPVKAPIWDEKGRLRKKEGG